MKNLLRASLFLLALLAGFDGQAYAQKNVPAVATIAALQALGAASPLYPLVYVQGYNNANDGGQGYFAWNGSSSVSGDSCTIFAATGVGTGRWFRQLPIPGTISVEMCGAYNNSTNGTATRTAFQAAYNWAATQNREVEIDAKGFGYLFDTTGVTKAQSLECPKLVGSGTGASGSSAGSTVVSFSPGSQAAAFTFIGGSGASCGGGISGIGFTGNSNTIAVSIQGQDGVVLNISTDNTVGVPVDLCNCANGEFTERSDITLTMGLVETTQLPVQFRVINGGNASFSSNALHLVLSTDTGTRTNPLILLNTGSLWYNGWLDANIHNISGGTALNLIKNNSGLFTTISGGTMQLESFDTVPISPTDSTAGPVYYGGSVYGLRAEPNYNPSFILARSYFESNNNTPYVAAGQIFNLSQLFAPTSVALNQAPINVNASIWHVIIQNSDASYVWRGTFTMTTDISSGGVCSIGAVVGLLITDTHSWGVPTVNTCSSFHPVISNGNWTGGANSFGASYDINYLQ